VGRTASGRDSSSSVVGGGAKLLLCAVPVLFWRSSVFGLRDRVGARPYGVLVEAPLRTFSADL
jgi:hypothetical protein